MDYWLAPTLSTLREEINKGAPNRDKASDGWIGDKAHASRDSDHNPANWPSSWTGVVRAMDIDEDLNKVGWTMRRVVDKMVTMFGKHPGLMSGSYIIYESKIISFDRLREGWRPYPGSNPHDKHAHISTSRERRYYNSIEPWNIFEETPVENPYPPLPPGREAQWNCKVGDRDTFPFALARFKGKKIIALLETGGHRDDIRAWAKRNGYHIVTGGDESSMLLVHKSVEIQNEGVLISNVKWYGPKGKAIRGRSFPWARVVIDGEVVDYIVVHMPWGYDKIRNLRAWISCSSLIRNFALRHPVPEQRYMGDFNQPGYMDRLWSILRTARRIGAIIIPTGAPVDYMLLRPAENAKRPLDRPTGHKGTNKMGSDHYPVTYEENR